MTKHFLGAVAFAVLCSAAHANCFAEAARKHAVDETLLRSIAAHESLNRPNAINVNKNGSVDYGLMQINSFHLPRLAKQNITAQTLLSEPCINIDVGASVLADAIRAFGPTWRAVGAYGAGHLADKEEARARYASLVFRQYRRLTEKTKPAVPPVQVLP